MNPLFFAQKRQGPLFVYYYRADERRFIERPFPEVPQDEWWSKKWDSRPHDLYNVSGLSPTQNAVYLALAWRLVRGLKCFGIPLWQRDEVAVETKLPYEPVNWEYSIYSNDLREQLEDLGFTKARTDPGPIKDGKYIDSWKVQNQNMAGLFRINSFREFIDIQKPSLVEAMSQTNYFAFKTQESADNFIKALKSKSQPQLKKLLIQGDIFIDIILGMDMGYPDAILIKSGQDISAKLDALVAEYNLAAEKYELRMAEIYEMNDFVGALAELAGVDNP
jgi:hypothetical protein